MTDLTEQQRLVIHQALAAYALHALQVQKQILPYCTDTEPQFQALEQIQRDCVDVRNALELWY